MNDPSNFFSIFYAYRLPKSTQRVEPKSININKFGLKKLNKEIDYKLKPTRSSLSIYVNLMMKQIKISYIHLI